MVSLGWTLGFLWKIFLMVQKGPEEFHHCHLWVLTSGKLLEFSVMVSIWVCCCSFSCVDIFVEVGMLPDAVLLWVAFFPGSYFLPLAASFFSATAKSLVICSCGYLELNNFFLIRKCATAVKHLVGCLKGISENSG